MTRRLHVWTRWLALLGMSGWLFQAGCVRIVEQQIQVLFSPDAVPTLIYDSPLVNFFGPGILTLFNR
jgi:hypothetical protein